MNKVRSHYDNLKVAPDAPLAVIEAAYNALAKQYRELARGGDARAARIMKIINDAFETLSDPSRRAEHDEWLKQQRGRHGFQDAEFPEEPTPSATGADHSGDSGKSTRWYKALIPFLALALAIGGLKLMFHKPFQPPKIRNPYVDARPAALGAGPRTQTRTELVAVSNRIDRRALSRETNKQILIAGNNGSLETLGKKSQSSADR